MLKNLPDRLNVKESKINKKSQEIGKNYSSSAKQQSNQNNRAHQNYPGVLVSYAIVSHLSMI